MPCLGFVMAKELGEYGGIVSPVSGRSMISMCTTYELVVSKRGRASISENRTELTAQSRNCMFLSRRFRYILMSAVSGCRQRASLSPRARSHYCAWGSETCRRPILLLNTSNQSPQGNVLIDDNFTARLCDFGLVRVIHQDGAKTGTTTATAHHGTVRYLAHELVNDPNPRPPSTASDVHALGCIGLEVSLSLTVYNN